MIGLKRGATALAGLPYRGNVGLSLVRFESIAKPSSMQGQVEEQNSVAMPEKKTANKTAQPRAPFIADHGPVGDEQSLPYLPSSVIKQRKSSPRAASAPKPVASTPRTALPNMPESQSVPDFSAAKGVFRQSMQDDINVMVNNYTAPALAMALRDREATLQIAATLAQNSDIEGLKTLLQPFSPNSVDKRRIRHSGIDLSAGFTRKELVIIQRSLHKMPRHVYQATSSRASVIIPLCNVSGVASILFERRSSTVRTHKHQVCFPGGMLDEGIDATIVQTSLREMEEELGIPKEKIEVLGILRCNWNEVANMTGIAVTPVVGFIGEIDNLKFFPNSDEVEEFFTIPIADLLDESKWMAKQFSTPMFTGGKHNIWGLTGYLLERFVRDVLMKCT